MLFHVEHKKALLGGRAGEIDQCQYIPFAACYFMITRYCLTESIPPHYAFQLHGAVQLGTCGGLHRQRNILPVRHIGRIPVSKKQETGKKQE